MLKNISRVSWLTYFFSFIWFLILGRLFYVQILRHDYYAAMAENQYFTERTIYPERGQIFAFDKLGNKYPLAINKTFYLLYASPKDIKHPDNADLKKTDPSYDTLKDVDFKKEIAQKLADIIGQSGEDVLLAINKENDPYERLKRRLTDEEASQIMSLNLPGIGLEKKSARYYPFDSLASHILGFVGYKNDEEGQGFYGLEGFYEDALSGIKGYFRGEKDTNGVWIPVSDKEYIAPSNGSDLFLTIDYNIQLKAEEILRTVFKEWSPESASIIVEDPSSGAIRALANIPAYNPNAYNEVEDYGIYQNNLTQKLFEPGSIFKPITASIALNEGKISENTTYKDEGFLKIAGYRIENFHEKKYDVQTMTQVIEKSINTGAIFIQQSVDKSVYKNYLEKYGLTVKTGIDLAGEVSGNISNLNAKRDIEYATSSFGQGISMTPLEIFQALSAIANKGALMKPRIVEKLLNADGSVQEIKPEVLVKQVIKPETALAVSRMMVSVVQNTYVKKMDIPGYFIAAKTGTAQIPDKGGYLGRSETIQSLVSFFPAFNPKYIIMIKMDKPRGSDAAGNSLPSYMKDMVIFLINYSRIPPDNPISTPN